MDYSEVLLDKCRGTYIKNIKYILSLGADPNFCDNKGKTPLYRVIYNDNVSVEIVQLLLDSGADVHHMVEDQPLIFIAFEQLNFEVGYDNYKNKIEVIKMMLDKGADYTFIDNEGKRCLDIISNPEYRNEIEEYILKNFVGIKKCKR